MPVQNGLTDRQRTSQQNRALHRYFRLVAYDLDGAGYEASETIKVPISFTDHIVKEYMFLPIAQAMFGVAHTSELTAEQLSEVVKQLQRLLAEKFGVVTPFPEKDS